MISILDIFLIAFAMSADAFSVAFGIGCRFNTFRHYFRLSFHFGLFQFIMPVAGSFIGSIILKYTNKLNILAAIILFYISYKMIKDALQNDDERCYLKDPTKGFSLIGLSVATSMDALGVGFSLALWKGNIFIAAFIIGVVCLIFTAVGIYLGSVSRRFIGGYAEYAGALVLMIIGIKFIII